MSALTVSMGLDAAGFISGVRSVGEQAERGMVMVERAYRRAAQSQRGLTDAAIAQQAQNLRNLGVADQEIAKYTETATALRMYKQELVQVGAQYAGNRAGLDAHLAQFGQQNNLLSLATIEARELSAQQQAAAVKTQNHARASQQLGGSLGGMIGKMRSVTGLLAGFVGARELAAMSDEWTMLNNRIRLVTDSEKNLITVRRGLIDSANATGQAIGATAQLYQRLAASKTELRLNDERLLKITDTINKTMVLGGGAAASQEAAIIQLSQAMASGQLRGQELNSVLEQAPALAQAIAKGMGITVGQLRQYSQAGELTAQSVVAALEKMSGSVDADFAKVNLTIGQSTQILKNKLMTFIGTSNDATGAASLLSGGIRLIADNIGLVTLAVGGLMALALAKWVLGTTVQVVALTAAMIAQGRAAVSAAAGNATYAASLRTVSGASAAGSITTMAQALGSLKGAVAGLSGLAGGASLLASVAVAAYSAGTALGAFFDVAKGGTGDNAINDSFEAWLRLFGLLQENESLGSKMYDLLHTESGEFNWKVLLEISPVGMSLESLKKLLGEKAPDKVQIAADVDAAYKKQQAEAAGPALSEAGKGFADEIRKMSAGFVETYANLGLTNEQLKLNQMQLALEKLRKEEGSAAAVKAAEADIAKARAAMDATEAEKRSEAVWDKYREGQKWVQDYLGGLKQQVDALGKSKEQLIAMEMATKGASEQQIQLAQSAQGLIARYERQKEIDGTLNKLAEQQNALGKSNTELLAMQMAAKGATGAEIAKAQAMQGVIDKYREQEQVMATLSDLDKQVAQLGMSDMQRQLDDLRRKGADGGQLAHAEQQLRAIEAHRKAGEQQRQAASGQMQGAVGMLTAAGGLKTGADIIRESAITFDSASQRLANIDYSKMSDEELYSGKANVRFGAAAEERRRRESERGGMYGNARGVVDLSTETLASLRRLNPNASVDAVSNSMVPISIKRRAGEKEPEPPRTITALTDGVAADKMKTAGDTLMAGAVKFDDASSRLGKAGFPPDVGNITPVKAYQLTLVSEDGSKVKGKYITEDNFEQYYDAVTNKKARGYSN